MKQNPFQPHDSAPTELEGPTPYSHQRQGGGGGYGAPERTRRSYQFPSQGGWQPDNNGGYPQHHQDYPNHAQRNEVSTYQPTRPAGAFGNPSGPGGTRPQRQRKKLGCLIPLAIVLILFIFLFVTGQQVLAFGSAISTQKNALSTQTGYMGGSNRVNILIMGFGGAGHDGAYLTDSMVIMSLIPSTHHTTLISVPRDLWVQNPANSGNYTKINAVYPTAAGATNTNPVAGGNAAAQKVSLVTGLQINYWITINFAGFQDFIDAIGGVDVYAPDSFNACYPKSDTDPAWIKVQFSKGLQHMDGARAIAYARAREPLEICGMGTSENEAELSDFGRSARQQLIMQSVLVKLKEWQTWPSLYSGMDKLKNTLFSNLSLADLGEFALKMDLKDAHRVGISNQNVLVDTTASDGEAMLLPQNNNWSLITTYIQQKLYN